ncbi:hypothetical protein A3E97_05345 [Candidatus Uhrbacteria bacterium RIFCSPHIGHO2_12_FULL_47_12]|uniref:Thymidine kinase n=1 Tax=Candidatus Uhrbacteria bacterium RIFCSPLOWO2_02_FULL_48_18 TaxID=1802408 RepID=A0A1F7VAR7_9BACT|nr:MAG: hypothetical protein A3E97_05345 [Candidatus Uhrbacteria bacterium RIFCSPHIGHO2_12_FULL_47_12]OGL81963.1 MAG: hypothetical protein A3B20_02090 [Candidatus Uhrbacteria bacterium RIFCSPLOWO2_01_FULL_47_17]OGL87127.1 MAG: hypothetical protein A3I41_03680 [Candidatus Uhrbacteria bacterium RIFCSPLOWO2_02_FULL_48_18]OGL91690.1 MAG: hypothetical protein A3H12_02335 [Candidatus Uhrbacteria bacterium RIFCSPLOWO2_12_FULL_47_9]
MRSMLAPELIVITGPMCSGKTEELIRYMRQGEHAKLNMLVVKPSVDTRDGQALAIKSRNGHNLVAIDVPNAQAILEHVTPEHLWIGVDEAHFFDIELVAVVMQLVRMGKRVIVSGLDLDYREKPFEVLAQLMALAQEVQKLTAVCSKCRVRHASRSQRLTDDTSRIAVGDKEYEPRCLQCFVPPNGVAHSQHSSSIDTLSS